MVAIPAFAVDPCNCKGYAGAGGPYFAGAGGPTDPKPDGATYAGVGWPCYAGVRGPRHNAPRY